MQKDIVLILDFGGQYNQLIARRVRECQVYCEVVPYHIDPEKVKAIKPKGIILSGGPASVYAEGAPRCHETIFEMGIPVLGICYGGQLMARHYGGSVNRAAKREYGKVALNLQGESACFRGWEKILSVG
jgi:GMP synthase (glutamine-hydrolysing)